MKPAFPRCPVVEAVFTMAPPSPCATIRRAACWLHNIVPSIMTDCTHFHFSYSMSSSPASLLTAALFTRMSTRPYASSVRRNRSSTCSGDEMSALTPMASPPSSRTDAAATSARSSRKSTQTTFAPSRASVRAISPPMFGPLPVTTATLPSSIIAAPPALPATPRPHLTTQAPHRGGAQRGRRRGWAMRPTAHRSARRWCTMSLWTPLLRKRLRRRASRA